MQLLQKYRFFVIILIASLLVEGVFLSLVLSSGEEAAADTEKEVAVVDLAEIEIGSFTVTNHEEPGLPLRVDFTVFAAVEKSLEEEFSTAYELNTNKIKEAITIVIRQARPEDLREDDLEYVKAQITKAIREIIGREKPSVQGVIIPNFDVYQI
ncbi:hypothetical protein Pan216_46460 [Planctomycetes bacterium Pan216]|uniref:Flagellar protein FliL n=1 Tax=Kolteria novifilia TaxID=2527975 RepID=A0A518B9V0_9BACT|nr:hypothetical protein Pan216_46460 [Planctomycetes bacterium Pan216]